MAFVPIFLRTAFSKGRVCFFVFVVVANVNFAAKNGLDAKIFAALIKIGSAKKVAMVGDGASGHAKVLGAGAKIFDANSPVKQAVFGMAMQMNKVGHEFSGNCKQRGLKVVNI